MNIKVANVENLEKRNVKFRQSPVSQKLQFWILKGVWKSQNNSKEALHFCTESVFKNALGNEVPSRPLQS